jgi:hypothetical protein
MITCKHATMRQACENMSVMKAVSEDVVVLRIGVYRESL